MIPNVLVAQLYALKAQIDAVIFTIEADQPDNGESQTCTHPEDKRRDATTAGGPRQFLCLACGQTVLGAM